MTSILDQSVLEPAERLFTAADLITFPTEVPSGSVDYELDDGRLVFMVPAEYDHGFTQSEIVTELKLQGQRLGYGRAVTEIGVKIAKNPDTVLVPDVAFIAKANLPLRKSPEGYLETIPDLVVEVRSKNDSAPYIAKKVAKYLAAGVGMVWVADSTSRTITAHRPNGDLRVYEESESLSSDEPIPGFRLRVASVFGE
jgi:Uma2 family endonuclease